MQHNEDNNAPPLTTTGGTVCSTCRLSEISKEPVNGGTHSEEMLEASSSFICLMRGRSHFISPPHIQSEQTKDNNMTAGLCTLLFKNLDWGAVFLAATAQQFLAIFYYGILFSKKWEVSMAKDKGVYDFDDAVKRFTKGIASLVSFFAAFTRTLLIVASVNLFKLRELDDCVLCGNLTGAFIISAGSALYQYREIAAQRPLGLQILEVTGDFLQAATAALVLTYFQ